MEGKSGLKNSPREPISYFSIDENDTILSVNRTGAKLLGTTPKMLIGGPFITFIPSRYQDTFQTCKRNIIKGEDQQGCDLEIVKPDGSSFKAFLQIRLRQSQGRNKFRIAIMDISRLKQKEAELTSALADSESARYVLEAMMENIPEGIAITGGPPDFPIIQISRYGLEMIGRPTESLKGLGSGWQQTWRLILPDGVTPPGLEQMPLYRAIHLGEEVKDVEFILQTAEGRKLIVLVSAAPIRDEQGNIIAAVNSWKDITERKQAEEKLTYLASFPELNPNPIIEIDKLGSVTYVNPGAKHIFPDILSLGNKHPLLIGWEEIIDKTHDHMDTVKRQIAVENSWFEQTVIFVESNQHLRFYSMDVTERKQAEESLRQREERFRILTENLHSGVALIDAQGQFTMVNSIFLRLFGLSPDSSILNINSQDWSAWQVYAEDGKTLLPLEEHPVRKAAQTGKPVREKLVGVRLPSGGDLTWMLINAEPVLKPDGSFQYLIATYYDITDRKLSEMRQSQYIDDLLALSQAATAMVELAPERDFYQLISGQLQQLVSGARLVIASTFDENSDMFRICSLSGAQQQEINDIEEILGQNPTNLAVQISPEARRALTSGHLQKVSHGVYGLAPDTVSESIAKQIEDRFNIGSVYAMGFFWRGELFGTVNILMNKGKEPQNLNVIENFIYEATIALQRKQAEEALKESEEKYRTLFSSLSEGFSLNEIIVDKDGNPSNYRILEINDAFERLTGLSRDKVIGKPVKEILPNIEPYWIENYGKVALTGKPLHFENYSGDLHKWYETYAYSPKENRFAVVFADITERKKDEESLKRYTRQLEEANNDLQQFAYVTSHDLREPLRIVTGFTQSLAKRYKDRLDQRANEYIDFIVDAAARMQNLIDDILAYSRVGTRGVSFEPVEMELVLQNTMVNLKMSIEETKANITHDPLPLVLADPNQMMQVLQNLISNAIKFRRKEVPPLIHISIRQEGEEWVFSVKDNGIGIEPELFGRLFVLFSRLHTQEEYPGTGVGLAITKRIIQRHNGRIWVESQPGKGSTFYFSLPTTLEQEEYAQE